MDIGALGILILALSGVASFLIGRWLSRGWRRKRAEKERRKNEANDSRQVRRARERQRRR